MLRALKVHLGYWSVNVHFMEMTLLDRIYTLKWPQDRKELAKLPVIELQLWIASQDPRGLVFLAQDREYQRFIKYHYLWPLKLKRLALKLTRFFRG